MLDALVVRPGNVADLAQRDQRDTLGLPGKDEAKAELAALHEELSSLQERLYAEGRRSVLLVLQGLDASGKDGDDPPRLHGRQSARLSRHVVQGTHGGRPGARLPVARARRVPGSRGARNLQSIALRGRRHRGVLGLAPEEVWRRRPERIVEFERLLTDEGTSIVKCFLHVSIEKQRERLDERLSDPTKRWKHDPEDEEMSRRYTELMAAYEETLTATSTELAPWYVIPADRNWVRNIAVATVLVEALRRLDPQFPS
jgi:polyphosphate kinase 2 (PPK2 family)